MDYAIETDHLTKTFWFWKGWGRFFEPLTAVGHVSLKIPKGRIFVLVGPNGAGKTTLLKLLSGLILPSSGEGKVFGIHLKDQRALKAEIGLVSFDERSFYGRLNMVQNLEFYGRLQNLPRAKLRSRIEGLLEQLGLEDQASIRVQVCSSGMKQRLAIARALLHDPPLLFFDEPTKSLDPLAARELRSFLKDQLVQRNGKTLFVTTHQLEEVSQIADDVAVMVDGEIKASGTLKEISAQFRSLEEFFMLSADGRRASDFHKLQSQLKG